MDKFNEIYDFFNSSFTKEYLKYNDVVLRYVAVLLESLSETEKKDGISEEERKTAADLCSRLIRSTELAINLTEKEDSEGRSEYINTAEFLEDFSKNCRTSTNDRIKIEVTENAECRIASESKLLKYAFLEFIRSSVADSEKGVPEFEMKCVKNDKTVCIHLIIRGYDISAEKPEFFFCQEIYDKYSAETCKLLAKRAGAECSIEQSEMKVEFAYPSANEMLIFESKKIIPNGIELSEYNVMLSELTN